jgi:hypothetical protein
MPSWHGAWAQEQLFFCLYPNHIIIALDDCFLAENFMSVCGFGIQNDVKTHVSVKF